MGLQHTQTLNKFLKLILQESTLSLNERHLKDNRRRLAFALCEPGLTDSFLSLKLTEGNSPAKHDLCETLSCASPVIPMVDTSDIHFHSYPHSVNQSLSPLLDDESS